MTWPDTNNTRCQSKSLENKLQTVGPLSFTPTCKVDDSNPNVEPTPAKDNIAAGALAAAKEELGKFYDNTVADLKKKQGYETMSDADKAKFDKEVEASTKKREALWADLKTLAKVDQQECDDDCKALFEADLLTWGKEVYEECAKAKNGIACREAEKIFKENLTRKAAGEKNFYSGMTESERKEFDKGYEVDKKKLESSLAAAWMADHKPAAGAEGSTCAGDTKCTGTNQCCGTAKPATGYVAAELKDICVKKSTDGKATLYEDGLDRKYDHTCSAKSLVVSVAAFAAAAFASM